jgi:hypothetical protein
MVRFTARILKFGEMGEKTGWTYIPIPADVAQKLKPGNKQSFRVKGKFDDYPVKQIALIPMGDGEFIIPFNADMRRGTGKRKGAMLNLEIEVDKSEFIMNADFLACLDDEPKAVKFFKTLPPGHQRYFSKWIDDAKTEGTRTKRIVMAINALARDMGFSQMLREHKAKKDILGVSRKRI